MQYQINNETKFAGVIQRTTEQNDKRTVFPLWRLKPAGANAASTGSFHDAARLLEFEACLGELSSVSSLVELKL